MGKHNVRHKRMHQKKQIGIKDNRAGCLGVPVLGAGFGGHIRGVVMFSSKKRAVRFCYFFKFLWNNETSKK